MTIGCGALLVSQLEFYWDVHLRPRLDGLTDEEYLWEPVENCWTLRPGADGAYALDNRRPEPTPAPVTTIAWRMIHVGVGLATRVSTFFRDGDGGGVPGDADMFDPRHEPDRLPPTAAGGIAFLEDAYTRWHDAIAGLDEEAFSRPLGPKGAYFAAEPMAALVAHLNREVMHHGGEICLMRDLYHATGAARPGRR